MIEGLNRSRGLRSRKYLIDVSKIKQSSTKKRNKNKEETDTSSYCEQAVIEWQTEQQNDGQQCERR